MEFVLEFERPIVELLQRGAPLPRREPWASMPNTGEW